MTTQFVAKGNGTAIHIAYSYEGGSMDGFLATMCDKWGSNGAYGSRIRPVQATAATCKSCLKNS